jgi:hypothetical protein
MLRALELLLQDEPGHEAEVVAMRSQIDRYAWKELIDMLQRSLHAEAEDGAGEAGEFPDASVA